MSAPSAEPPKVSRSEELKQSDPTLSGSIASTLADVRAARFAEDDTQFLKFHGIYQQDDRDKRRSGKEYMFMVRTRIPGGAMPGAQYLAFDRLSDAFANGTLRITARQGFQFHGTVKQGLGPLIRGIHESLSTTLAACGDVSRNVMAPATPATGPLGARVREDALLLSRELLPQTPAYHQIWIDGNELNLADKEPFVDPLYGPAYLPRKFKVAFAIPPLNDTDVFTNCLGFVAIADPNDPDKLLGYNLLAGGGLGMSHGNAETFPRTADVLGFFPADRVVPVAKAVVTAYRDHGDRSNRKHARLKYVIEERGADWFRSEVEARAGFRLDAPRPVAFASQGDRFGWNLQHDGRWFLGLYVETGRIKDTPQRRLKTALREVLARGALEVRLTPSQNLILAGVPETEREAITAIFAAHGVTLENQAAAVRRSSMACPALPTCGLALAEAERALPGILDGLETVLSELGLAEEDIVVRMTGCPNGCARPYMAEIGIVGRAPGKYGLFLGGSENSTRLNRLYRESVKIEDLVGEIRTVLVRYKDGRQPGERFGDFCVRAVL